MIPGRRIFVSALAVLLPLGASTAAAQHKPKDADCLICHGDPTFSDDSSGQKKNLSVDPVKLKHSIHGGILSCVDCHTDVKDAPHEAAPQKVSCAQCHADAQQAYQQSYHAKVGKNGSVAATCQDCHGGAHEVLPADDAHSPVYHAKIPATCGRCHGQKFLMESNGVSNQPFLSYQESVHGQAIEKGSKKAAVCTDCHGSHEILAANEEKSPIYKFNVPATCGKCHEPIEKTYNESIHGQAIAHGNSLAPVCTDCHGIHSIKSHTDPKSPVAEQNLARATCARCHEGVRLSQEFGVAGNRISSYLDSYHGLAAEGGSTVVANCASCHGVHNIYPSSDPRSTINHANLDTTCGKCHQGVTQRFTESPVHISRGLSRDPGAIAVLWIRRFYLLLIFAVIGAMFLHNAVIWRAKVAALLKAQTLTVQRMSKQQRIQHLVLLISFFVLVVTGFALKYPYSWLAHLLHLSEHPRSVIHRIAGVVLIAAGLYHLIYAIVTREGRKLVRDLAPAPKDAFDAWAVMRYYLGLGGGKPRFGRFSYAEKAEYWALVWGTALMAVTGIMLWAKVWVGNLLARWWVDAATAVHFYEAILATLAIIVWHFYQVFFDPDVYPMNRAWLDGKMDAEHYSEEHQQDTETTTAVPAQPVKEKQPEPKAENKPAQAD